MKTFLGVLGIVLVASFFAPSQAEATYVNGYYRSNGTYVEPHYRSNPNGLTYDNYSYRSGSMYNSTYQSPSYGSSWNTPSYTTQPDYYSGYNSYRSTPRSSYNPYIGY